MLETASLLYTLYFWILLYMGGYHKKPVERLASAFLWLQSWVSWLLFPHIRECPNCRKRLPFFLRKDPGMRKTDPLSDIISRSRWSLTRADTISAIIRKRWSAIYHYKSNKYSICLVRTDNMWYSECMKKSIYKYKWIQIIIWARICIFAPVPYRLVYQIQAESTDCRGGWRL